MLQIGICDDEALQRQQIHDMAMYHFFAQDDAEFVFFESGQEVIAMIEEGKFACDLLFLDIHMPGFDGLEVAAYIRDRQIDVDIIFLTVSREHVFDGYTYNAFSYMLKPIDGRRFGDEIGRYLLGKYSSANCLHVTINKRRERILLDQVYYFEADVRVVRIHGKGEQANFYAKLGDVEKMLKNQDFIRCHQSYLVNKKFITGKTRTELWLENGEVLPISRKYLDIVRLLQEGDEEHE